MLTNTKKLLENNTISKLLKIRTHLYFGWVLFIALLTLLPGQAIPNFNWDFISIDKLIHFSMFFIMAFLGALYFSPGKHKRVARASIVSILLAFGYGFILEYFQTFIPQRAFDYADLTANAAGASAGIISFLFFQAKFQA